MAHIDDSAFDTAADTGKEHSLKPPVGNINQFLVLRGGVGQGVAKYFAEQERLHTAKRAGKEVVRLFQGSRRPALGTLVFYE